MRAVQPPQNPVYAVGYLFNGSHNPSFMGGPTLALLYRRADRSSIEYDEDGSAVVNIILSEASRLQMNIHVTSSGMIDEATRTFFREGEKKPLSRHIYKVLAWKKYDNNLLPAKATFDRYAFERDGRRLDEPSITRTLLEREPEAALEINVNHDFLFKPQEDWNVLDSRYHAIYQIWKRKIWIGNRSFRSDVTMNIQRASQLHSILVKQQPSIIKTTDTKKSNNQHTQSSQRTKNPILTGKHRHDFGDIQYGNGAELQHIFTLENATRRNLQVKDVKCSCGCMSINYDHGIITSGDTIRIDIMMNISSPGRKHERCLVLMKNGTIQELFLTATAISAGQIFPPVTAVDMHDDKSITFTLTAVHSMDEKPPVPDLTPPHGWNATFHQWRPVVKVDDSPGYSYWQGDISVQRPNEVPVSIESVLEVSAPGYGSDFQVNLSGWGWSWQHSDTVI